MRQFVTYAPTATIVVTGYPKLFGEVAKSCSIGNLGGTPVKLPASLTAMANMAIDGAIDAHRKIRLDAGPGLNDAIAGGDLGIRRFASVKHVFVDVDPAFQTHRLCDTGDRWISGLVRGAPVTDRGLHPNMAGMSAFAGKHPEPDALARSSRGRHPCCHVCQAGLPRPAWQTQQMTLAILEPCPAGRDADEAY